MFLRSLFPCRSCLLCPAVLLVHCRVLYPENHRVKLSRYFPLQLCSCRAAPAFKLMSKYLLSLRLKSLIACDPIPDHMKTLECPDRAASALPNFRGHKQDLQEGCDAWVSQMLVAASCVCLGRFWSQRWLLMSDSTRSHLWSTGWHSYVMSDSTKHVVVPALAALSLLHGALPYSPARECVGAVACSPASQKTKLWSFQLFVVTLSESCMRQSCFSVPAVGENEALGCITLFFWAVGASGVGEASLILLPLNRGKKWFSNLHNQFWYLVVKGDLI